MNKRRPPVKALAEDAAAIAPTAHGELVLYPTEDGAARFHLRAEGGSVWLTRHGRKGGKDAVS